MSLWVGNKTIYHLWKCSWLSDEIFIECAIKMVSTWQSKYLVENLSEDFDEHFKTKSETPLINYYKVS